MKSFEGKFAAITGGGTGMGRELARQLAAEGCSVAMCDVSAANMAQTQAMIDADRPPQGTRVTAHVADVADEDQLIRFREEAKAAHDTDVLHLLFNNAGIGGGGGFVNGSREAWERTFNICWGGVYLGCRTFLPMMLPANEAHIVNTASVNGFWASLGPNVSHTAYAAAKFAVKGFTEALITDLRLNAPHIKCSVVMPGHIGTAIASNSRSILGGSTDGTLTEEEAAGIRAMLRRTLGDVVDHLTAEQLAQGMAEQARRFLEDAPTTAAQAATIILDGVREDRWRILVGEDAHVLDRMVRETPEEAYEPSFYDRMAQAAQWRLGGEPAPTPSQ